MTDQPFQTNPADPTQATIPSQGGVFGGFVGVEEVATPKIPDTSELFGEKTEEIPAPVVEETPVAETPVPQVSAPVVEETPAVEEITSFEDLNLPQTESAPVEPAVEEPVVATPAPVVEEIPAPVVEETPVVEEPTEEVNSEDVAAPVEPVVEETPVVEVSDIKAKYNELANNISALSTGSEEAIQIIGSNTDTTHVEYTFTKEDEILEVTRSELNKETDESTENVIAFVADIDDGQIQVFLDDTLLFEEQELLEDPKKKMQVMEKFNKFIFLTGEKIKDAEKARKAQEAELQEKRRLQDIFRNF